VPVESEKSQAVERSLPTELRPVYRRMVQEYEFFTHVRYGRGYVAYEVLGQMVLSGWRPSAEPHPDSQLSEPRS
jgi:hypothetical protein